MNSFHWKGNDEEVVNLGAGSSSGPTIEVPGWPARFLVPKHLVGGILNVLRGEYEPTPPPNAAVRLKPGTRILDIGANVGAFAAWCATRFPGCHVDSYEPNPRALAFLEENARQLEDVHVHRVGVRSESGTATLHEGRVNLGEASFHRDTGGVAAEGEECAFIDAAQLPDTSIVKVDTEGCEVEILERYLGSREHVPLFVMLEFHRVIDRIVLEELLAIRGLRLTRGGMFAPDRGTMIFARVAPPERVIVGGDASRLADGYAARVAWFAQH